MRLSFCLLLVFATTPVYPQEYAESANAMTSKIKGKQANQTTEDLCANCCFSFPKIMSWNNVSNVDTIDKMIKALNKPDIVIGRCFIHLSIGSELIFKYTAETGGREFCNETTFSLSYEGKVLLPQTVIGLLHFFTPPLCPMLQNVTILALTEIGDLDDSKACDFKAQLHTYPNYIRRYGYKKNPECVQALDDFKMRTCEKLLEAGYFINKKDCELNHIRKKRKGAEMPWPAASLANFISKDDNDRLISSIFSEEEGVEPTNRLEIVAYALNALFGFILVFSAIPYFVLWLQIKQFEKFQKFPEKKARPASKKKKKTVGSRHQLKKCKPK